MLIKIDPVLSPDLLFHLRSMGHGEKLILADANFPANTTCLLYTSDAADD